MGDPHRSGAGVVVGESVAELISGKTLLKAPIVLNIYHPAYRRVVPAWCWTMEQLETVTESAEVRGLYLRQLEGA